MENFGDRRARILCGKHLLLISCAWDLSNLKQHLNACRNKVAPSSSTFLSCNTNSVGSSLPICWILIAHSVNEWLHDVVLELPRLWSAKLQDIIHDADGPLSLCR